MTDRSHDSIRSPGDPNATGPRSDARTDDEVLIRRVASEQGVSEQTIRAWFDRDRPRSGRIVNGRRRPTSAWAASLPPRAPGYSVPEAMKILGVSKMTVHRWFDRDAPASGRKVPGRGGLVRRCDPVWVEQMRLRAAAERARRAGLAI